MENKTSLTSLRFFAAYMVVASHYFSVAHPWDFLNRVFVRGHLGVEFFFILSGFVLGMRYCGEIQEERFNPARFFYLRFVRIAPAYYLSLILSSLLLIRGFGLSEFLSKEFNRLLFIALNVSFLQSYIPVNSLLDHWNLPSWSLSVEMLYYVLFPVLAVPLVKTRKENLWLGFLFTLAICIFLVNNALPSTVNFLGVETRITWVNTPFARLPQFLIGVLLARKYLDLRGSVRHLGLGLFLGYAGTLLIFTLPLPYEVIGMGSPLSMLVFALVIFYSACADKGNGVLNNRFLVFLGEASYSLYIFQVPLKTLFQQIFTKVLHLGMPEGFLYCGYLTVTMITASCFLYRYFELPVHTYLRKLAKAPVPAL